MKFVLSNEQMQAADKYAIDQLGLKGEILMESAGKACAELIDDIVENENAFVAVLAGKGNNGGDGYVVARYLLTYGHQVKVFTLADKDSLRGDALFHYEVARNFGVSIEPITSVDVLEESGADIIVDALLGTGTKGEAKGIYAELIEWTNRQDAIVFAVDIPSGLNGNSSRVSGPAVKVDYTFAIQTQKPAHVLFPARDYCGEIFIIPIGIPQSGYPRDCAKQTDASDVRLALPQKDAHKYSRGEVLIIGGDEKMIGAVNWAITGAQHSGAGYITAAIPQGSQAMIKTLAPSAVTLPLPEINRNIDISAAIDLIKDNLDKTRSILIGNGLGRSENRAGFFSDLIKIIPEEIPLVIDADGLFLLKPMLRELTDHHLILTPHRGELRHLFGDDMDLNMVETERWKRLQEKLAPNWLLIAKGNPTVTLSNEEIWINGSGGPELAIAGSGDLLAGYLAGLCAYQPGHLLQNAITANYIHGYAGEIARTGEGFFGVTMDQLCAYLPLAIDEILQH